ncbi:MAG TPA: serine hydrolase [Pseudomonadales bacterium]|nr:serine hydrolase [Pseudomonadales bacterium]
MIRSRRAARRRASSERLPRRSPGPRVLLTACLCLLVVVLRPALAADAASTPDPARLTLASVQAAVARVDAADGEYLFTKQAERSVPIASVTKLMTALVVRDSGAEMEEWLEIVEREKRPENNGFSHLRIGSELRRRDLLRIMLQASENLASYALAAHYPGGYDGFVAAMNAKAAELGMTGTRYVGTSGLSPDNLSTAADLVRLARAAYRDPVIREYSIAGYFEARFRNPRYSLTYGNTNPLTHSSRWDVHLSKTGYLTEAGRCLVMVADMDGEELIVVLLDSFGKRSPLGDAGRIRRWLTTGDSGGVADAAARYAREKEAAYVAQEAAGQ